MIGIDVAGWKDGVHRTVAAATATGLRGGELQYDAERRGR